MLKNHPLKIHLFALIAFSAALFLPMMGRGFIHDDFGHLYSVAYDTLGEGLTRVHGGPFYTPATWLTFKINWLLGGRNAFAFAGGNLLIHILNTLLLYCLALRLWRSPVAAWWTAFGFALLFPANTWAVMWISTRAHLLATLFSLAALLATLWFTRTAQHKFFAGVAIALFAALSMFAKESGVTVIAAIAIVIFYERRAQHRKSASLTNIILFAALFAILATYLGLRAQSGAVPLTISGNAGYSYTPSLQVLGENFLRYGWRTYGLLALVAAALTAALFIRGQRPSLASLTRHDVLLSALLFLVMLAPFILLRVRSGIYTYLPGIGAALLLGAVSRALSATPSATPQPRRLIGLAPIVFVVAINVIFTVGHSLKWMQMAAVNTTVLQQIAAQQPVVKPHTHIVLTYSEIDRVHRFPEGFAAWSFPDAIRLLYADPTLNGSIVQQGAAYSINDQSSEIRFAYVLNGKTPHILKTAEVIHHDLSRRR